MLITEAVFSLAGEDMSSQFGNILNQIAFSLYRGLSTRLNLPSTLQEETCDPSQWELAVALPPEPGVYTEEDSLHRNQA